MAPKLFRRAAVLLIAGGLSSSLSCPTQTLARPGWAGSGLNGEPWWRSAVFYRIDPVTFQDSDGDGIGDLAGIASRLDYLQTLGVDAVIVEPPSPAPHGAGPSGATVGPAEMATIDQPGFDDLLSEASRRHLRLVVVQPLSGDPASLLARARSALSRGAAGIELVPPASSSTRASSPGAASPNAGSLSSVFPVSAIPSLLADLRTLAASFPGERVVLSDLGSSPAMAATAFASSTANRRPASLHLRASIAPELLTLPVPASDANVAGLLSALRTLVSASDALPPGEAALFAVGSGVPGGLSPGLPGSVPGALPETTAACAAVRLLTLRGAIVLSAGQELGLPSPARVAGATAGSSVPAPMQWTPRNITPPSVKIEPNPEPAAPTRSDVYGAYRPYVPVKPRPLTLPGAPQPPPDPDGLPGFTSGELPANAGTVDPARRNVAVEDGDPRSLLNLYRRLIALHHGHATLRTGSTAVLDSAAGEAVVWVRRAPAGARTVASVIMACNLSGNPLSLSLDAALESAHIRPGLLRPLLGTAALTNGPQSTAHLTLAPHGLYIGEIYHH